MFCLLYRYWWNTYIKGNFFHFFLSCNWLIMLVTMATPISSHVKDKDSIFTARDEDMIFWKKEKSWYFTSIYIIKNVSSARWWFKVVIELSGVQFGLKSYAWFENRTSAHREFDLKSQVWFRTKIARREVQLPLYYSRFEIAQIQDLVSSNILLMEY